jgi:DNA replication licensing factor MCM6
MFARQFKPMITEEARKLLVENYGHLRQRDSGTSGKGTWRITVRQLESMVRLSEAMAKIECSQEVTIKHVREAYRLLNKSIIRVEQPDIHFDDEDDAELVAAMEVDAAETNGHAENGNGVENGHTNGHDENGADSAPVQRKKKLTLSFEEYKKLSNMLVIYMRNEETRQLADGEENGISCCTFRAYGFIFRLQKTTLKASAARRSSIGTWSRSRNKLKAKKS